MNGMCVCACVHVCVCVCLGGQEAGSEEKGKINQRKQSQ